MSISKTYEDEELKHERVREKARERMARNRRLLMGKPLEDQEAARARAREAQARYRLQHRLELKTAQKTRRMLDYIQRYGQAAYDSKIDKRTQNQEAKADQMRRAARRSGSRGKTKRAAQAREKTARRAKGRS